MCVAEHPGFTRRLVLEDPPGESLDFVAMKMQIREFIEAARSEPAAFAELWRAQSDPRITADGIKTKVRGFRLCRSSLCP